MLVCDYDCKDYESMSRKVTNIINVLKYTYPYKDFYGDIEKNKYNNILLYSLNYYDKKKSSKYDYDNSVFEEFNPNNVDTLRLYGVNSDVPTFFKTINELTVMFSNNYYKRFNVNYFESTQLNPTLWYSKKCSSYILTPTISPLTNDDIVVIAYTSDRYYTSIDFYFNPDLIIDMYNSFCGLVNANSLFILINSLEAGSNPEMFHYHIIKAKMVNIFQFSLILDIKIEGNNIYVIDKKYMNDWSCPYGPGYFIVLENNIETTLKYITSLLWECRSIKENTIHYKYYSQIFLFKIDDKKILFISFRRIDINDIRLTVNNRMIQSFYDKLFGETRKKYGLSYLPIGIVYYYNYNGTVPVMNNDILNKMKSSHYYLKQFEQNIHKIMNINFKHPYEIAHEYLKKNFISSCLNMNYKLGNLLEKYPYTLKYANCDKFPIIYTLAETTQIYDSETYEQGRCDISGMSYYYIKLDHSNHDKHDSIVDAYINNYQIHSEYLPNIIKYYGSLMTLSYDIFLIFSKINTTLETFILIDAQNLRYNSLLIEDLTIQCIYTIFKLDETGYELNELTLNNLFVSDTENQIIEYRFNKYVVISSSAFDTTIQLHSYGFQVNLRADNIQKKKSSLDKNIKIIIQNLYQHCSHHGINNIRLNNLNNIVSKNTFNFNEILDEYKTYINYLPYKTNMYAMLKLYGFFNGEKTSNGNELYFSAIENLDNINYIPTYGYEILEKNQILITGTGPNNEEMLDFNVNTMFESRFYSELTATWFAHLPDLYNNNYLELLYNQYMYSNDFSRLIICGLKKNSKFIKLGGDEKLYLSELILILAIECQKIWGLTNNEIITGLKIYHDPDLNTNTVNKINNLINKMKINLGNYVLIEQNTKFVNDNIDIINDFYLELYFSPEMITKINIYFGNEKLIGQYYEYTIGATLLILQDFYNLGLRLKMPDISGTTNFLIDDNIREYVLIIPKIYSDIIAVLNCDFIDNNNGEFVLFSNYEYYRDYISSKLKTDIHDKTINIMSIEIYKKYLKKWSKYLDKIAKSYIKNGFNFYNHPLNEEILKIKIDKNIDKLINGGRKNYTHKYLKYKYKYTDLKNKY